MSARALGAEHEEGAGGVYRRMGSNLVWLLGGRGFQAVASLIYLGVAARALGRDDFGAFTLALAYGQAIANLAQFQSWHAVIRYGALHLAAGDEARLKRLLGFTTTLDIASALGGAAVALLGVGLVAGWLGWSPAEQTRAALFGATLLLSIGATPNGILRLVDRFDLITYCQAVGPLARLIGSAAAAVLGWGVAGFLAVWAAAALGQSAITWGVAVGRRGRAPAIGRRRFASAARENEGIWRFMLATNASSTLAQIVEQVGTLVVGGVAGAATAGGFRLAAKLAKALARPVQMLARVLYPEVSRLAALRDTATLGSVMARANGVALLVAIGLVGVAAAAGPYALALLGGPGYRFAYPFLLILAVASAIDLSGFALEPLLIARGGAGRLLLIRLVGVAVFAAALACLLARGGAEAVAMASVASALVVRVLLGRIVRPV